MRVKFQTRSSQAGHLKAFQRGGELNVAHMAYGAGLGEDAAHLAVRHLLIPAGKGAVRGAASVLFSDHSGSYADKLKQAKRGAVAGCNFAGVLSGKGVKKVAKAKRPF